MYSFKDIEAKWQNLWADIDLHRPDFADIDRKFYALTMFCYPSGDKLHVGHWYAYGPPDTFARFMKMQGYMFFSHKVLILSDFQLKIMLLSMVSILLKALRIILIQ